MSPEPAAKQPSIGHTSAPQLLGRRDPTCLGCRLIVLLGLAANLPKGLVKFNVGGVFSLCSVADRAGYWSVALGWTLVRKPYLGSGQRDRLSQLRGKSGHGNPRPIPQGAF